ncbi:MAG TPA: glycosyltransferase, partial [Bryobacteraceae bacterium]|nr:glycosyltransferase [Bryobacteraceae bacterium]
RSGFDPRTQRELTTIRQAASLFNSMLAAARAPMAGIDLHRVCGKYYLQPPCPGGERVKALVVSPFAVYPPTHGSARRTASLIEQLSSVADVILLSDEESAYGIEQVRSARGPISIHLAGGRQEDGSASDRISRIRSHSHNSLRMEMERLARVHKPAFIQIEHMELAALTFPRKPEVPHVLDLHDVHLSEQGCTPADRFEQRLIGHYDAVVTCSEEDARLVDHARIAVLPNGFTPHFTQYRRSRGRAMLFAGPFRYKPNLDGIVCFLNNVYPRLIEDVAGVELIILGGNGARDIASRQACFAQPGVVLIDRPVEIGPWLERCALTLNPLAETRGSCVKVIESIAFGRVCVSTDAGARGFRTLNARSLVTVPGIQDFHLPVRRLLLNDELRARIEQPDHRRLSHLTWESIGRRQLDLYREWFGLGWPGFESPRPHSGGAPVPSPHSRRIAAETLRE